MLRNTKESVVLDSDRPVAETMAESHEVVLDVEYCRSHFPGLKDGWAYLDNAGGSYLPQAVIDVTMKVMTECRTQPNLHYASGAQARECLDRAQQGLADMLGVKLTELVFGANTTVNFYVLAHGLRAKMQEGDEIIVTDQDHEANIGCWRKLNDTGIVIKEWKVDPVSGLLNIDDLRLLITGRTKVVCFTHASNVVAATNDVEAISKLAHEHGAVVCVDGVAYSPHAAMHLKEWDVDFYGFSLYKVYGPHLGIMYCKEGLEHLFANQNHYFLDGLMPPMLNPGGRLYTSVAGISGLIDYVQDLYKHHFGEDASDDDSLYMRYCRVFNLFAADEERMSGRLIEFLKSKPRVHIIGPATAKRSVRMPTISFVVDGMLPIEVATAVGKSQVAIGGGTHFYAARLCESMGLANGVVRVSLVHYNTDDDIQSLIMALDPIVS